MKFFLILCAQGLAVHCLPKHVRAQSGIAPHAEKGDDLSVSTHAEGAEDGESDDEFDSRLAAIRKNKSAPGSQRKAKTPYEQLQENKKAGAPR